MPQFGDSGVPSVVRTDAAGSELDDRTARQHPRDRSLRKEKAPTRPKACRRSPQRPYAPYDWTRLKYSQNAALETLQSLPSLQEKIYLLMSSMIRGRRVDDPDAEVECYRIGKNKGKPKPCRERTSLSRFYAKEACLIAWAGNVAQLIAYIRCIPAEDVKDESARARLVGRDESSIWTVFSQILGCLLHGSFIFLSSIHALEVLLHQLCQHSIVEALVRPEPVVVITTKSGLLL